MPLMRGISQQSAERRLWRLALGSRLIVLVLTIICNLFVTPYDSSSIAAFPEASPAEDGSTLDAALRTLLRPLASWDGIYFTRLAQYGYEYEQFHAFFPLLPTLARFAATLLALGGSKGCDHTILCRLFSALFAVIIEFVLPGGLISGAAATLLCGTLISWVAFAFAALFLFRFSLFMMRSEKLAFLSAALFCFNPASIFLSAFASFTCALTKIAFTISYTESVFAMFAFAGMWFWLEERFLFMAGAFFIAGFARSNAFLLAGFPLFSLLRLLFPATKSQARVGYKRALVLIASAAVAFIPFIFFQIYGFWLYCSPKNPSSLSSLRPWCSNFPPLLYSFVQDFYWNVGFMRYWTLKQLPNFLLAAPVLTISFLTVGSYLKWSITRLFRLLFSPAVEDEAELGDQYFTSEALASHIHLLFLACYALVLMHVQVSTRFLFSQCPPLYWFAARAMLARNVSNPAKLALGSYFVGYFIIGSCLFSTFYPWT